MAFVAEGLLTIALLWSLNTYSSIAAPYLDFEWDASPGDTLQRSYYFAIGFALRYPSLCHSSVILFSQTAELT